MKKTLIRNDLHDGDIAPLCGVNLLSGITPVVLDEDNREFGEIRFNGGIDKNAIERLTLPFKPAVTTGHIDIETNGCSLIYDLKNSMTVDRIVIAGFFNGKSDYGIADYDLYLSETAEDLFKEDSHIIAYNNAGLWKEDTARNHCDQVFDTTGYSGRYFCLKINKANPTDDIIRLSTVGLYNHDITDQLTFSGKTFGDNALAGLTPTAHGSYSADLSYLTDGICFNGKKRIYLDNDTEYIYTLKSAQLIGSIGIVGSSSAIEHCVVYLSDTKDAIWNDENLTEVKVETHPTSRQGLSAARFLLCEPVRAGVIGLKFSALDYLDEISLEVLSREVSVFPDKILCDDFVGFGVNCLPMALMEESLARGYNDVYWALEKSRILKARPAVVRFWFQLDWVITTKEDYENGVYDFNSPKMQSVYRYLDAFLEAGSEIELNFGWKTSLRICDWLNVESEKPQNAAPKDLDLFAVCCSATLKELLQNRGYSHIKYLTFFNEANYGVTVQSDFNVPDHKPMEYYFKLFKTVRARLQSDGLLPFISMWGCEQSGQDDIQWEWTQKTAELLGTDVSTITQHRYHYSYDELMSFFARHKALADGHSMVISEYGVNPELTCWNCSHAAYSMAVHNAGYSGALLWTMSGVLITDPCSFMMNNSFDLWHFMPLDDNAQKVNPVYGETSLQMNYIPPHAASVLTEVYAATDIRAAAYTSENDISLFVEVKESTHGRTLDIDLRLKTDRPLYRYTYKRSFLSDGNAVIVPCDKTVLPTNTAFSDTLDADYQLVLYTTILPKTQVTLDKALITAKAGDTVELSAEILDGEAEESIDWSVCAALGAEGKMTDAGAYTVSKKAEPGDMVAIKAALHRDNRIYGVAVIKVIE